MTTVKAIAPLQSWDVFSEYLVLKAIDARKKADCIHLDSYKLKYDWDFTTSDILEEDYTTIVITDSKQNIQWVSAGFSEMTGYPKTFAIGKHPRFLQGQDTSQTTKNEIKNTLADQKTISKQLLNYKKDGTPYLCDIKIIPLFDTNSNLTHFMALEKKARVA